MNRVVLVGRITRDPELRNSPNGVAFVSFSIAVNRVVPNAQGERVADFIYCIVFNKQAENLNRFIRKGGLIGVEGRLQSGHYQAQDGTNRTSIEVVCDTITFLEPKAQNQGSNDYNQYGAQPAASQQVSQPRNQNYPNYQNQGYQSQGYQNQGYQNNYNQGYQQPQYSKPSYTEPKVEAPKAQEPDFASVDNQFEISDDDLPF